MIDYIELKNKFIEKEQERYERRLLKYNDCIIWHQRLTEANIKATLYKDTPLISIRLSENERKKLSLLRQLFNMPIKLGHYNITDAEKNQVEICCYPEKLCGTVVIYYDKTLPKNGKCRITDVIEKRVVCHNE